MKIFLPMPLNAENVNRTWNESIACGMFGGVDGSYKLLHNEETMNDSNEIIEYWSESAVCGDAMLIKLLILKNCAVWKTKNEGGHRATAEEKHG